MLHVPRGTTSHILTVVLRVTCLGIYQQTKACAFTFILKGHAEFACPLHSVKLFDQVLRLNRFTQINRLPYDVR